MIGTKILEVITKNWIYFDDIGWRQKINEYLVYEVKTSKYNLLKVKNMNQANSQKHENIGS